MPFEKGKSGNPDKKFKKGASGNPKGRPKLPDLKEIVGAVLGEEKDGTTAAEAILQAMRSKAAKGDVKAAQFLFDHGFGKPVQKIEAENNNYNYNSVDMTPAKMRKIAKALEEKY